MMNRVRGQALKISRLALPLLASIALAACASTPPPLPAPPPAPIVYMPPNPNPPPPDEWNRLPDPTTGQADAYPQGGFGGPIPGKNPATPDPPIPHPVATPA